MTSTRRKRYISGLPCTTVPHLKKVVSKGIDYYYIAESYREGSSVKTRIIRKLGTLTQEELQYWKRLIESPIIDQSKMPPLDSYNPYNFQSLRHGIVALGHALWNQLGFNRIITSALSKVPTKLRLSKLCEIMVINRLEEPCSKLFLLEWLPKTSLPFILSIRADRLYDNVFYRAMDELWKRRDSIEKMIWEQITKPRTNGKILQKDLTSSYFEGLGPTNAKRNHYSRDHRPDCTQICWGLVETEEGYPITMEIYPGNTVDKTTIDKSCKRLKNLFNITSGIFVGDRGLTTDDNIETIRGHFYDYVLAETNSNVLEIIEAAKAKGLNEWERERPTQQRLPGFESPEGYVLKGVDIWENEERYVIVWSNEKEQDDLEFLEKQIRKGQEIIESVNKYAKAHPKVHHHKILKMATRNLDKKKVATYFDVFCKSEQPVELGYTLTKKVAKSKANAGYWVLHTSLKTQTGLEIIEIYRGKWVLERTFEEIKSVLKVRPIRHRKETRAEVHIWICVLAYLMEKIAEVAVRRNGLSLTGKEVLERFREVRLNEDGFKGLEKKWWTVTELNDEQRRVLSAMNFDEKMLKIKPRTF